VAASGVFFAAANLLTLTLIARDPCNKDAPSAQQLQQQQHKGKRKHLQQHPNEENSFGGFLLIEKYHG